jgi:hypothetical protein
MLPEKKARSEIDPVNDAKQNWQYVYLLFTTPGPPINDMIRLCLLGGCGSSFYAVRLLTGGFTMFIEPVGKKSASSSS